MSKEQERRNTKSRNDLSTGGQNPIYKGGRGEASHTTTAKVKRESYRKKEYKFPIVQVMGTGNVLPKQKMREGKRKNRSQGHAWGEDRVGKRDEELRENGPERQRKNGPTLGGNLPGGKYDLTIMRGGACAKVKKRERKESAREKR